MKKFIVALLLLGLFASCAMAATPVTTYILTADGWKTPAAGTYGLGAQAFIVPAPGGCGYSSEYDGHCCKEVWNVDITNTAVVTQWLNYKFGGQGWSWQVRKPGEYAADCLSFFIQSNADVNVSFSGFDHLTAVAGTGAVDSVAVAYSYTLGRNESLPPASSRDAWYTPEQLNQLKFTLPYEQISGGLDCKLWNRIEIKEDTHAGTYTNTGTVTFTLTDVKDFIDPVTGDFKQVYQ
ncbi:MAG TPA: hypothetical protein PLI94_07020 [Bacillota bacterium]|jgi:hypothetical protein|nr:hypothetical protein [Bacillota bacterium]HPT67772.1 hypothetical protein [Bacillota bacterium]